MRELRGDELRKMNQSGMLPLIYAHLMSLALIREVFFRQTSQGKGPMGAIPQVTNGKAKADAEAQGKKAPREGKDVKDARAATDAEAAAGKLAQNDSQATGVTEMPLGLKPDASPPVVERVEGAADDAKAISVA